MPPLTKEESLNMKMDAESLKAVGSAIGTAGVMVMDEDTDIVHVLQRITKFYYHESCGQCTPCRVGTVKAAELLQARDWDHATLDDLSTVMIDASICGLGQAAPNPVRCVQKYFPHEVGGQP